MKQLSLQIQNMTQTRSKTWTVLKLCTHFVSSMKKTLESLEEIPLSTKKLSQVKYKKIKKVKEAKKRKVFNLTDSSGGDHSGEGEMTAELK